MKTVEMKSDGHRSEDVIASCDVDHEIRRTAKARSVPGRVFPFDPTSRGQNGPTLALRMVDLNANERRLFMVFDPYNESQQYSIKQLAELAWPELGEEKAYSYARNQLRRLIRGRLLRKLAVGIYGLSAAGVVVRSKAGGSLRADACAT